MVHREQDGYAPRDGDDGEAFDENDCEGSQIVAYATLSTCPARQTLQVAEVLRVIDQFDRENVSEKDDERWESVAEEDG